MLDAITKTWGSVEALKPITLNIQDGEFLVLLGPSGCGKTTTMRIVAGLETATSGRVLQDGTDITDILPRNRNMAMVFQNYALYPHMTALENIAYPLRARGVNKHERERLSKAVAEKVNLGNYLNRRPKNLSGGQRQRIALARALVRDPDVFLMDEPLSNLDAKLRGVMRAEIKHLQRETGVTMIYVTHDQIEAMTLADRIVIMDMGEIRQIGTPDEIYNDPANLFVAGFVGSPPMNFFDGTIADGTFIIAGRAMPAEGITDTQAVQLGVRAEDIIISNSARTDLVATVYSVEPTGEATLVVAKYKDTHLVIKTDKETRPEIGSIINLLFTATRLHFFRSSDGRRLRAI